MKKKSGILLVSVFCLGALLFWSATDGIKSAPDSMKLVWSDEFDSGSMPDTTKWNYDLGDGCPDICGWGNNELQYYTDNRKENVRIEDGHLVIEARQEKMGSRDYTSTRLKSKLKGDWTYGRIVARAKLPKGLGVWPAIWMLPTEWAYGGWPASGEIDIIENVGFMPDSLFGTIHTKKFNGSLGTQVTKGVYCSTLSTEYHDYEIQWNKQKIDFLFDGSIYQTFNNNNSGFEAWPFDKTFHLLMNIAVGGNWGGKHGVDVSIWPQRMYVDYVRVYQ
ncbi:MAG: glycoside hydrolase family 16 protein [Saprospiraceae bacterium]|uniref:Glycoside hydrolase family 16 protein n=1 Tax=Candidatus Opimibacter skivensis TaxID=2982028 RepID=A0A9D7XUG9_9BACT|nr:glycoside hydrolase family 16 protein [Candidatus Opimibacter skivensis]